jgi:hypothetical protein
MQGPFPGGQLVQFNRSGDASLTNFYAKNDADTSHPEDVVSVVDSPNVTVSNGVIDGDNSPSGVGVMFEGDSQGGQVSNVDAIHMGDGAFSSYSDDVTLNNVHAFDNIDDDQGRGTPMSDGLLFFAEGSNVSFLDATYTRPADADNIVNGDPDVADISADPSAVAMSHVTNTFSWSTGSQSDDGTAAASANATPATSTNDTGGQLIDASSDDSTAVSTNVGGSDVASSGSSQIGDATDATTTYQGHSAGLASSSDATSSDSGSRWQSTSGGGGHAWFNATHSDESGVGSRIAWH